jgi:hypothetical protein
MMEVICNIPLYFIRNCQNMAALRFRNKFSNTRGSANFFGGAQMFGIEKKVEKHCSN